MTSTTLILITRENAGALRFASKLQGSSATIHIQPFFKPTYFSPLLPSELDRFDSLLITSRHAVAYLKTCHFLSNKPCLVVGSYTKDCLLEAGFENITHCAPSAVKLFEYIETQEHLPHNLLYIRGRETRFDFKSAFKKTPVQMSELITYESTRIEVDIAMLSAAIMNAHNVILPVFSVQTALQTCDTISQFGEMIFQKFTIIAMSQSIADALRHYPWKKMMVSRSADLQSVADMVMLAADSQ